MREQVECRVGCASVERTIAAAPTLERLNKRINTLEDRLAKLEAKVSA